jgi:uncharacterized protein
LLTRSRYLRLIPEGECVIAFSALSGGMVRLPPELAGVLTSGSSEALNTIAWDYPELLCIGAMVDENVDERDLIRVRMGQARFGDPSPHVTIVPTLACNFRCPYCDQPSDARTQTMCDEIAEAVVAYIGKRLDGVEQFSVTWYGGEPLLELDRVVSMQQAILLLCGKRGIGLLTSVATNGWFLDASTAKRLADAGIRDVQVALDGPPEVHNLRRFTLDGDPTFDRILENALAAREHLEVSLRVSVDGDNVSGLPDLLDRLAQSGLADNVYLAPVVCYEAARAGIETPFQNGAKFGAVLASLMDRLCCGDASARLTPTSLPCHALRDATYVFGPKGHVYRCWHELGHPEVAIDHAKDGGGNPARRLFWLNYDPLLDPECAECDVLPLCLGGCPEQRRKGIRPPMCCSPLRWHLDEFVRSHAARSSEANAQRARVT